MKKQLFTIVLLSVSTLVFSQSPNGKITYKQIQHYTNNFPDTLDAELNFTGYKSIYYYDKNTRVAARNGQVISASGSSAYHVSKGRSTDSIGRIVYTDKNTHSLITREIFQSENFIVPDSIAAIDWKFGTGHKLIANIDCKNAYGVYRGREYEAWYTDKIPVSYGPWKLCGLPGIILEARSKDNEIVFIAESIQIPAKIDKISPPTQGKNLKDYAAYRQLQDQKASNYARFVQSMSSTSGAIGSSVNVKPAVNRIEKSL